MKLKYKVTKEIQPTALFNFDATFHKPAHFSSSDNYWELGIRWQTFRFLSRDLGVVFKNAGSVDKPKIKVEIYSVKELSEDFIEQFIREIRYRYNLDLDLSDFYKLFSTDKFVGPVIKRVRGMRPGHQDSLCGSPTGKPVAPPLLQVS